MVGDCVCCGGCACGRGLCGGGLCMWWWGGCVCCGDCACSRGVHGKSLYLPLNFAVNLKLLLKKFILKETTLLGISEA